MTTTKQRSVIPTWRIYLGPIGLILLIALGTFAYFGPRDVSTSAVRSLCRQEAERQTKNLGVVLVDSYNQDGLSANFTLLVSGGKVKIPVTCVVSGDAQKPKVALSLNR